MKKLLVLTAFLFISTISYSQEKQSDNIPKIKSKSIEFMSEDGVFIKKQIYYVGKIKGLKLDVLIITNLVNQKKIGCIQLESGNSLYNHSGRYIGILDYDEIDACIKSLNYIVSDILPSNPEVYTETNYISRDGVNFRAYCEQNKHKWTALIYTQENNSSSTEDFDSSNITDFVKFMESAKNIILEKLN